MHHLLPPPPRVYCFTIIYINPIPCTLISSKELTAQQRTLFAMARDNVLMTIFDYQPVMDVGDTLDATKCCTYYIHVKIHRPDWVYHLRNHRKVTIHYVYE